MNEPLPQSPLGQKLCECFPYRWRCLEGSTENTNEADWKTITKYPLRPRTLWAKWQDARTLIGVRFGKETSYAILDIDAGSPYLQQLHIIRAALETIGIVRTILIRSSWSGGVHLYIPLPEPVGTFDLACALKQCMESQGFQIVKGQLEIFPNTKAHARWWKGDFTEYQGHRLPLQPGSGSVMLNEQLQPTGGDLQRFFYAWDMAAMCQDAEELRQALRIARNNRRKSFQRRAVGPVDEWQNDLELEVAQGWTGPGQTNGLLKTIACYGRVFERLEGSELADYVERIATSRPGYERYCHHHHDITVRCRVWAAAVEKYYWPLGTEPKRDRSLGAFMNAHCKQLQDDARDRIATAYAQLKAEGLPQKIRNLAQQLTKRAATSMATLYKHLDLWHPEHTPCNSPEPTEESAIAPLNYTAAQSKEPKAEVLTNQAVTALGGEYEGCRTETSHLKNLSPEGRRGDARGEEGFSTGSGCPEFSTDDSWGYA